MIAANGYAVKSKDEDLAPFHFERRALKADDVLIDIHYCGICHSDVHQVKDEWGGALYPMVPGHEIVGIVREVGEKVTQYQVGDAVGVGCLVNSCQSCLSCGEHLEQYCENGFTLTYNDREKDGSDDLTFGGYSDNIVVNEKFVLSIPNNLEMASVAPLLCAGITTYSPLKYWGAGPGKKVAVIGLGGLGHMAVQLSHALGAHTTLLTHSKSKVSDGKKLGADEVILSQDEKALAKAANSFDLIINTASSDIDLTPYLNTLKREGTLVLLGVPEKALEIHPANLIFKRANLAGSLIGGIKETQEMLEFCGQHQIGAQVEVIPADKINEAYDKMLQSQVKYRFVIDCKTFQ